MFIIFLVNRYYITFLPVRWKYSFARQSLNMSSKGLHSESPHSFNIRMLILSWPWALFGFRLRIIFDMSLFTSFSIDKRWSVRKWSREGSLLSFLIKEHCFAKKELKSSAFCLKSVTNLLFWNNGGITGVLRLFRKIFNRAQYALVRFWIVFNFWVNLKACVLYFYQIFIFSPNDSSSKTMKNAFYFI